MKALITSLLLIQAVLCMSQTPPASNTGIQNLHSKPDSLRYTIIPINNQYGYDIFVNGHLRIQHRL
jgi:hypothetical protein